MIETEPKVKNATVEICFEPVGSRQHGVAARSGIFNQPEVSYLLNALGNDSGFRGQLTSQCHSVG